jgi:hypothetical protein
LTLKRALILVTLPCKELKEIHTLRKNQEACAIVCVNYLEVVR